MLLRHLRYRHGVTVWPVSHPGCHMIHRFWVAWLPWRAEQRLKPSQKLAVSIAADCYDQVGIMPDAAKPSACNRLVQCTGEKGHNVWTSADCSCSCMDTSCSMTASCTMGCFAVDQCAVQKLCNNTVSRAQLWCDTVQQTSVGLTLSMMLLRSCLRLVYCLCW